MRVIFVVLTLSFISQAFAAANKDMFGSKLRTSLFGNKKFGRRALANSFLSKNQCLQLAQANLKKAPKTIKSFTYGSKIGVEDINGEFTPLEPSEDYGHYAKLGLSDDNIYEVKKLNTQFAIHADERCARYAKVAKVDRTLFKGKSCRRIHVEMGTLAYKAIFCKGDRKGYVDHFDLTTAI